MARDILAAAHLSVDSALFIKRLMDIDSLPPVLALMNNVYYPEDQARVDDETVPPARQLGLIDLDANVDPHLGVLDAGAGAPRHRGHAAGGDARRPHAACRCRAPRRHPRHGAAPQRRTGPASGVVDHELSRRRGVHPDLVGDA